MLIDNPKDLYAMCPQCDAVIYNTGRVVDHCGDLGGTKCAIKKQSDIAANRVATITLNDGSYVLVDYKHMPVLKCYAWSIHRDGYAYGKVNGKNVYLHRLVYQEEFGEHGDLVDHVNGNRLDCRCSNLRRASHSENRRNTGKTRGTSKYIGVYYNKKRSKWCASIQHEKKNKHIGYYDKEIDAAKAYNAMARLYYGEFAKLNEVE